MFIITQPTIDPAQALHSGPLSFASFLFAKGGMRFSTPAKPVKSMTPPPLLRKDGALGNLSLFHLSLRHKAVADATHGLQMDRMRRIIFEIPPQSDDKVVDGAGVCVLMQMPDLVENLTA